MTVGVIIRLKAEVAKHASEGSQLKSELHAHGLSQVKAVRAHQYIVLDVEDTVTDEQIHDMCKSLLVNKVTQEYELIPI